MRCPPFFADALRRLVAAGGIALVLLLAALTSSPELHRLFHGPDEQASDDGCAVVQFSHGVSAAVDTAVVALRPVEWQAAARTAALEIFVASPRFLHLPERGPPLS